MWKKERYELTYLNLTENLYPSGGPAALVSISPGASTTIWFTLSTLTVVCTLRFEPLKITVQKKKVKSIINKKMESS